MSLPTKEDRYMPASRNEEIKQGLNELKIEIAITKTENQASKERLADQNSWINVWTAIFLGIVAVGGVITFIAGRNQAKKVAHQELRDIMDRKLDAELVLEETRQINKALKKQVEDMGPQLSSLLQQFEALDEMEKELSARFEEWDKKAPKDTDAGSDSGNKE